MTIPKEQASRIIRDFELSSKLLPHRSELHIGGNCQPIYANGIELTDLIKFCHKKDKNLPLQQALADFLKGAT